MTDEEGFAKTHGTQASTANSKPIVQTAHKAHWAGGVVSAIMIVGAYALGVVDLDQAELLDHLSVIGTGLGTGATAWLGAYAPRNRPKVQR